MTAVLLGLQATAEAGTEIDWGKTAFLIALVCGGLLVVFLVVRGLSNARTSAPATPSPSGPSTRKAKPGEASGPKLKKTVAPAKGGRDDPPSRVIAPVAGTLPPEEGGPKLRMSMGRGPDRVVSGSTPMPSPRPASGSPSDPSTVCSVCSTVFPTATGACPACGEPAHASG